MKKVLYFLVMVMFTILLTSTTAFAKSSLPKIIIDNKEIKYDVKPYMKGNDVIVPIDNTLETFGAKVEYDKKTNIVKINMNNTWIELPIGKKVFYIYNDSSSKGQTIKLSTAIKRDKKGVTFIEGKKFFESLDISVTWDIKKKELKITKPKDIDLTKDIPYTIITKDDIKAVKQLSKWYDSKYKKAGIHYKKHADVMYVLVGAGKKATGGYTIDIDKISYKTVKKAYVYATVKSPSPDMMVTQAVSYPNMLIKIVGNKQLNKVEGKIEEVKVNPLPSKVNYEEITSDYFKYNDTLMNWYKENNEIQGIHYTKSGDYMYVLIGAGEKPTGGYSITIDDVLFSSNDTVSFKAKVTPPGNDVSVIMMITYPSKLIRIESDKINYVIGDIVDNTKQPENDKWITLDATKVTSMELLDLEMVKLKDVTGSQRDDIIKSFNDASISEDFYIFMITGRILKVTTSDGYVLTFTSYGSDTNVVATIEKDQESRTFHLIAPTIAKVLLEK